MKSHRLSLLALVLASTACSLSDRGRTVAVGHLLPQLDDAVVVFDTATQDTCTFRSMTAELADRDVVFLGETHLDDTTHRVEAAVLESLIEDTGGKVVLSMEMFERDVQPALDDYLAGRIDEAMFLERSRPWGNYPTAYRPLVELAKRHGLPVVAANAPLAVRRIVSRGGEEALNGLSPDQRALLPAQIHPTSASYWDRVDRAVRGHMTPSGDGSPKARMYGTQSLWDNCMGDSCAQALARYPGYVVLHVVGAFHVSYRQGTVEQLLLRAPAARVSVVTVSPVADLHSPRPAQSLARADYLVYARAVARDQSSGAHAVTMPGELRYYVDLPEKASDDARVPLLVWLHDDATSADDARSLWDARLGADAAVATVIAPYPERQDDLVMGGRWSIDGLFREDQERLRHGLERLVEYVTRRYPVDPQRVVVAGRGSGATSVLWATMYSDWLGARCVAVEPTELRRLQMEGLPDGPPAVSRLDIVAAEAQPVLVADYRGVGIDVQETVLASGAEPASWQVENAVRVALGLPVRSYETAMISGTRTLLVLEYDTPRARQWGEIEAQNRLSEGGVTSVGTADDIAPLLAATEGVVRLRPLRYGKGVSDIDEAGPRVELMAGWKPEDLSDGAGLPLASGPFGGTTVLVVPAGASAEERAAWLDLEKSNAIKRQSRFASLRVAYADEEPGLATVLAEIRAANRSNVLIVPAVFCATAEQMQQLRRSAGDDVRGLDISWLAGLGPLKPDRR